MPVSRTEIETNIFSEVGVFKFPVIYTDEFIETSLFDFVFTAVGTLPYLFVGYFTDGGEMKKWFFSNARRHEDMKQAVEQDLGKPLNYTYGQIWLKGSLLEEGVCRFNQLVLHSELPNKVEAERLLRSVISSEYLTKDFMISLAKFG